MRQLATYCFSSSFAAFSNANNRYASTIAAIEEWLVKKGADRPLESEGFFQSKTKRDDTGIYSIVGHSSDEATLVDFSLDEKSQSGLDFRTELSVLQSELSVTVYCTLSVSSAEDAIADTYADARCPSVIRELLGAHQDWNYADNAIRSNVDDVNSPTEVGALVDRIRNPHLRKMPLVLVSEFDGEEAWPGIAEKLSKDLLGVAEVFRISEGSSRLLSQQLGKMHSCYLGAIRLYWPATNADQLPRSFVWTEESLLPDDEGMDDIYAMKFRSKIRNLILSATAVSISAPKQIVMLRKAAIERELRDERKGASERITKLEATIEDLNARLEKSELRVRVLAHKLQQAVSITEIPDAGGASNDDKSEVPSKGDVRYYKKIANAGKADKMAETNDCGHTSWQSSHSGHKAKKGLARLLGSSEWKSMHHCGTCTGGGIWKVEF